MSLRLLLPFLTALQLTVSLFYSRLTRTGFQGLAGDALFVLCLCKRGGKARPSAGPRRTDTHKVTIRLPAAA